MVKRRYSYVFTLFSLKVLSERCRSFVAGLESELKTKSYFTLKIPCSSARESFKYNLKRRKSLMDSFKKAFCIFLLIILPQDVSARCVVHLKNDRTLKADSCRKEGEKVELINSGLSFSVNNDLVREIIMEEDEYRDSSPTSNKKSQKKEISGKSKKKKTASTKKGKSGTGSPDQAKISEITKQVEQLKKAYEIIDKKPEDF